MNALTAIKKFVFSAGGAIMLMAVAGVLIVLQALLRTEERQARAPVQTVEQAKEKEMPIKSAVQEFGTSFIPYSAPPIEVQTKNAPPQIPQEIKDRLIAAPEKLTLYIQQNPEPSPAAPAKPSSLYLPSNRLIICRLINAVDSSNIETPIIAQVMEPVYAIDENGVSHEVIPAGIEITGWASASRMRDRLSSTGSFKLIWRVPDPAMNGKELDIAGIALNREYDPQTGMYGITDGSAGIRGDVINSNSDEELKTFAAAFISGLTPLLADSTTTLNQLTNETVQTPKNTAQNAALGGVQAVMQEYLMRMRLSIAQDGYFVAVKPGTQFYVYTTLPIDVSHATRPGAAEIPASAPPATTPAAPRLATSPEALQ